LNTALSAAIPAAPNQPRAAIATPPQRARAGGRPWGEPTPTSKSKPRSLAIDSTSAPSSDWRHHAMSPHTPGGGRPLRQPPPQQSPFWPSLDDPPLPGLSATKAKLATPKPKGAWASRSKA
jgi:hypothetical protein